MGIMQFIAARQMSARKRAENLPGERDCKGDCKQGEGDCDWDDDCLPGLKCKFDWWWGEDYCVAGQFLIYNGFELSLGCMANAF